MRKKIILIFFYVVLSLSITASHSYAQSSTQESNIENNDTLKTKNSGDDKSANESSVAAELAELKLQLMQMQLNEILLRSELEKSKTGKSNDDAKNEQRRRQIDSLRNHTVGASVVVEGDTLFSIYSNIGGVTAAERAENASEKIFEAGVKKTINSDSLYILEIENVTEIMYGEQVLFSVTDNDAIWVNSTREEFAQKSKLLIEQKLIELREDHSVKQLIKRIVYFVLVLLAQFLLFKLTVYVHRKLKLRITKVASTKLRSVVVKDYEFLTKERQTSILLFFALIARYIFTGIQLIISIPILFSIFPQTETLAMKIFSYIYIPVKSIAISFVDYIPNIFKIAVIYLFVKYTIKGLRYIAGEIENQKLRINGFYPDWAQPTFNIVKFMLYAFMIAMIYPCLPGADSEIFKGVSVFVGIIVSLGSTAVIGNIVAGLVITYMRPFKIGDRIKLNDTVGNVVEKTPFVTRIRTPKNEIITIPNSFILSSHTINYSASANDYGLIIHTSVTIGYDAPWRTVHSLLIEAAKSTDGVCATPEPFVLETELSDFYPVYQINAYIKEADKIAKIYSDLHQNIQDKFNEASVEIMSPHYRAERDGNASTIPRNK